MIFHTLQLKNFMVFQNATLNFDHQLNVIVGENASGKTQLLKLLFALVDCFKNDNPKTAQENINETLFNLFRVHRLNDLLYYCSETQNRASQATISVQYGNASSVATYTMSIGDKGQTDVKHCAPQKTDTTGSTGNNRNSVVFLPARELLTVYKNFYSLNNRYQLPYDSTYNDIMLKLGMPYLRQIPEQFRNIVECLENAIDGKIFLDNEQFYYRLPKQVDSSNDMDVNMAAEGWRKLAMILQLLKNGELHEGMALLWDEPDANLNPQLICLVAKVIVELSQLGIQVFLTTHNLFLVNELEIVLAKQHTPKGARFFNLQKGKSPQQGNSLSALKNVMLLDEDMKQSDRYLSEEI